jgi:hypothetical protein
MSTEHMNQNVPSAQARVLTENEADHIAEEAGRRWKQCSDENASLIAELINVGLDPRGYRPWPDLGDRLEALPRDESEIVVQAAVWGCLQKGVDLAKRYRNFLATYENRNLAEQMLVLPDNRLAAFFLNCFAVMRRR